MSVRRCARPGQAFLLLVLFDAVLRLGGLQRALRLARRLGASERASVWHDDDTNAVAHGVAMAAAFYPRRALCLEQSLALYVALGRAGAPAKLRIGVRPLPFVAHAWVEIDGIAINEAPDIIAQLTPFPGLGG